MSTSAGTSTREIEFVLRRLAKDPDLKIATVAKQNCIDHATPEATKAVIWAWLTKYNGGRRIFSEQLVDRVLAAESAAPAAKPRSPANNVTARNSPSLPAAPSPKVPQAAASKPKPADVDDLKSPWEKRPGGPRTIAKHRAVLETMAGGAVQFQGPAKLPCPLDGLDGARGRQDSPLPGLVRCPSRSARQVPGETGRARPRFKHLLSERHRYARGRGHFGSGNSLQNRDRGPVCPRRR